MFLRKENDHPCNRVEITLDATAIDQTKGNDEQFHSQVSIPKELEMYKYTFMCVHSSTMQSS